jgi:hypothetical protein
MLHRSSGPIPTYWARYTERYINDRMRARPCCISASRRLRGKRPSTQSLWHRIRYHYRGNAEGSTLRLTLGCLLAQQLGIQLRRVGSGKRMTFAAGEPVLSEWMAHNAFVTFQECERPWELEAQLVRAVSLPLNLDQNRNHHFHSTLTELRKAAKQLARSMDVLHGAEHP